MDLIDKLKKALATYEKELQGVVDIDEPKSDTNVDDNVTPKDADDNQKPVDVEPKPADVEQKPADVKQTPAAESEKLVRESTYIESPTANLYGVSLRGRSHFADSKPCQDYHKVITLSDGWIIATVSDGAGSAAESARGSKANCELACEMFKMLISKSKWIENNYLPSQMEWHTEVYNIFSLVQDVIKHKAQEESVEAKLFNATLLVVISTPKGLLSAHIGDGRMGYRTKDNEWSMMMTPHKGDEANQTVFIPNEWNKKVIPTFRMSGVYLPETYVIERNDIDAFVMLSDGCEQAMWKCHAWNESAGKYVDRNQPQEAFLNPLLDDISRCKDQEEALSRLTFIVREGTSSCQRETDDQTVLMAILK